jgi:hypothetical protein
MWMMAISFCALVEAGLVCSGGILEEQFLGEVQCQTAMPVALRRVHASLALNNATLIVIGMRCLPEPEAGA